MLPWCFYLLMSQALAMEPDELLKAARANYAHEVFYVEIVQMSDRTSLGVSPSQHGSLWFQAPDRLWMLLCPGTDGASGERRTCAGAERRICATGDRVQLLGGDQAVEVQTTLAMTDILRLLRNRDPQLEHRYVVETTEGLTRFTWTFPRDQGSNDTQLSILLDGEGVIEKVSWRRGRSESTIELRKPIPMKRTELPSDWDSLCPRQAL